MENNSRLLRLLGVLRTLADLGPVATAEGEFRETAAMLLSHSLAAMDAHSGALIAFDMSGTKLTCLAAQGEISYSGSPVLLAPKQALTWSSLKTAQVLDKATAAALAGDAASILACVLPLRVGTTLVGALVLGPRAGNQPYNEHDLEALMVLHSQLALVIQNKTLAESLRVQIADNLRLMTSLHHSMDDALDAFATAIDAKDNHLRGHSQRVARYAAAIANALGMSEADVSAVRAAAHLHDIGKVSVDKSFFAKKSALRPEEFRQVADHTVLGHEIVSTVRFPWPLVPDAVRWHHERADGSGYPDRLHNDEILLPVRIIAVADTFDAMTSERPYREPRSIADAAEELVRLAPSKFDSSVVQGLLVQLRLDAEGRSAQPLLGKSQTDKISPLQLDQLSLDLVRRLSNQRVYSA